MPIFGLPQRSFRYPKFYFSEVFILMRQNTWYFDFFDSFLHSFWCDVENRLRFVVTAVSNPVVFSLSVFLWNTGRPCGLLAIPLKLFLSMTPRFWSLFVKCNKKWLLCSLSRCSELRGWCRSTAFKHSVDCARVENSMLYLPDLSTAKHY